MIANEKAEHVKTLAEPNGYIDPHRLIEDARNPNSPLHGEFNWNVEEAAYDSWMETARTLIRFVKLNVTIQRRSVVAPYYVVDPERPAQSKRYVELTIAGRNEDVARQVLMAELDRIAAAIRRAQQIADVLGLSDELEQLLDDVTSIKTASERRAEEKESRRKKKKAPGKRKPRGGESRPRA